MIRIKRLDFIGISFVLVLAILPNTADRLNAQTDNTTFQNTSNISAVWNMEDHTIALVDKTTNESKIIGNFTVNPGNTTTN